MRRIVAVRARRAVLGVVAAVALLDIATGLWMLISTDPWRAHGTDTLWSRAAAELGSSEVLAEALLSAWQRIGAFSFFAGVSSLVWLVFASRDRRLLAALLLTYLGAGLAFGYTDARWFSGTAYHAFKQVVGVAWLAAIGLHFGVAWPDDAANQPGRVSDTT